MTPTPNHSYNVPSEGAKDWHKPLNENFEQYDTDIEIRDTEGNRGNYTPKAGAKFLATDTGTVSIGDGSSWNELDTTGPAPTLSQLNPDGDFLGVGRSNSLTNREGFGVTVEGSGKEFGGMYMETTSTDGRPFYGYGTDGDFHAYHYYDPGTGEWILNNSGGEMAVDAGGGLSLSGSDPHIEFPDGSTQRHAGPAAYGSVKADTTLTAGTPNVSSVSYDGDRYVVEFDDFDYNTRSHVSNIQLTNIYNPQYSARAAAAGSNLVVYIFDADGNNVEDDFQFTVHRP